MLVGQKAAVNIRLSEGIIDRQSCARYVKRPMSHVSMDCEGQCLSRHIYIRHLQLCIIDDLCVTLTNRNPRIRIQDRIYIHLIDRDGNSLMVVETWRAVIGHSNRYRIDTRPLVLTRGPRKYAGDRINTRSDRSTGIEAEG